MQKSKIIPSAKYIHDHLDFSIKSVNSVFTSFAMRVVPPGMSG